MVTGSAAAASVARGVTAAFTPPNGAAAFSFGFNSRVAAEGFVGFYSNQVNFAPLRNDVGGATGCSIRFAAQKRPGGSPNTDYAVFGFACLRAGVEASPAPQGSDIGYLLGLENADPYRIVLLKGPIQAGLPSVAPVTVLRASSATFQPNVWQHLRLDVIVNPNGDVVLATFANDLAVNPVTAPVWTAIAGMAAFTDDALGILSGSAPLSGGYAGYGFWSRASGRSGFLAHWELSRQV